MVIKRFEVWLINLDPAVGNEIMKTRPCLVISPDVVNLRLETITIVPMTKTIRAYPTRVSCQFQGKSGQLAIDQIKSMDKIRFVKKLGVLDSAACSNCLAVIQQYFSA